jgi:hypothetical protein
MPRQFTDDNALPEHAHRVLFSQANDLRFEVKPRQFGLAPTREVMSRAATEHLCDDARS